MVRCHVCRKEISEDEYVVNWASCSQCFDKGFEDYLMKKGLMGIGGAPMRATTLPTAASERKKYPIASGLLDYFPDALVAIAHVSWQGNEQHNPGQPLHWAREKSTDEADTMLRHFAERGSLDQDGIRHTAKAAWRLLAYLQKEIEGEGKTVICDCSASHVLHENTCASLLPGTNAFSIEDGRKTLQDAFVADAHRRLQGIAKLTPISEPLNNDVAIVHDDHGHEAFVSAQKMGFYPVKPR